LLRERTFSQGGALTIADRNGVIVAREPFPERFVGTRIPDPFMPLVTGTESGTMSVVSQDGTDRIIGYYPATEPLGLYISAGISQVDAFRPIDEATRNSLALAAIGGAVAFFVAWLFGHAFIRRPVVLLTHAISRWREGDHKVRTGMPPGGMELHRVGASLDTLLDQLEMEQQARERAERHRNLLSAELDHRVKNMLATAQVLASQTFREDRITAEALRSYLARLFALGKAYDLLAREQWNSAQIAEVVGSVLNVFESGSRARFSTAGPDLRLNAKAALALSMALHELSTNAAKYGALSNDTGTVRATWALSGSGNEAEFQLLWVEQDGPKVLAPTRRGFGSQMIEKALASELSGSAEVSFESAGLRCRISCPAAYVLEPSHPRAQTAPSWEDVKATGNAAPAAPT
jgi:two-component sensor histidine kinase